MPACEGAKQGSWAEAHRRRQLRALRHVLVPGALALLRLRAQGAFGGQFDTDWPKRFGAAAAAAGGAKTALSLKSPRL